MLDRNGQNNVDGSFDWINAIADASVMAGLTFFTTLGGTSAVGIPTIQACVASAIAAFGQFFLTLAVKRGLREKATKP